MKEINKAFAHAMMDAKSRGEREEISRQRDEEFSKRKDILYKVIGTLVAEKRREDPNFNLTIKTLSELLKERQSLFLGLTSVNSVLRYWGGELNFLKEKLGLPFIRTNRKNDLNLF